MISCKHECMGEVITYIFARIHGFDDCNVYSVSEFKLSTLFCYCFSYLFLCSLLLFNPSKVVLGESVA